jgi:hypothetical protein
MAGSVSLSRFAWACMEVDAKKIEGFGSRMWDSSSLKNLKNCGYSEFSCVSSQLDCKKDRTMLLPKELIKKHEDFRETLIPANNNGEFEKICEEIMNETPTQTFEGAFSHCDALTIITADL